MQVELKRIQTNTGWVKRCKHGPPQRMTYLRYWHMYKHTNAKIIALRMAGEVDPVRCAYYMRPLPW